MTALPRILDARELPEPELCAARLDGELFPIAGAWAPIDVLETAEDRARAAATGLPASWILERGTAAWVWGARWHPPPVPCVCSVAGDRGPRGRRGVQLRTVVIRRDEIVGLGGIRVTSPARTLVDLARADDWDAAAARQLADGLDERTLRALSASVRHAAHGIRAVERLETLSRR